MLLSYFQDETVWHRVFNVLFCILNLSLWGFLWFFMDTEATIVSLHYSIYSGVDFLGAWQQIFMIPLFGLIVGVFNFVMAFLFKKKDIFLAGIFGVTSVIVQILLWIVGVYLLYLNNFLG